MNFKILLYNKPLYDVNMKILFSTIQLVSIVYFHVS